MKAFTALDTALDETNKTNEKIEALTRYFASVDPADAAWVLYFLIGRRPRAAVTSTKMHLWAIEAAGIPDWLFGECYDAAGDCAETVALLLPDSDAGLAVADNLLPVEALHDWIEQVLLPLRDMDYRSRSSYQGRTHGGVRHRECGTRGAVAGHPEPAGVQRGAATWHLYWVELRA